MTRDRRDDPFLRDVFARAHDENYSGDHVDAVKTCPRCAKLASDIENVMVKHNQMLRETGNGRFAK